MEERPTLEIIAPTVEEAIAQGLDQLGLSADAVSVEVLDAGTKGLFGMGGRQVRVRLTVHGPGGAPAPKPEPASRPDREAAPVSKPAAAHDPILDLTESVISTLLHSMGLEAQISAHFDESDRAERRSIRADVRGKDLSMLIGRHTETLNAFQYIASLIVGKEAGQFVQLVVDVEGFRARREKQLRQMAQRMADQCMKMGRRVSLEPMSAAERRIVHMELQGHPAVMTESTGEEPRRKVTIVPKE
ncbi:MAG TPA: RNA-binding cell elongation regulator Jag/EloR [Anaerolineales bacterium]|nr:RNA-binding cell elongation regulator Jag/EloR [Anaerolineales bacterium]